MSCRDTQSVEDVDLGEKWRSTAKEVKTSDKNMKYSCNHPFIAII